MGTKTRLALVMVTAAAMAACAVEQGPGTDLAAALASGEHASLIEGVSLESTVVGALRGAVETQGFVVSAGRGAVVTVTLDARDGDGAIRDAVLQAWGRYDAADAPGEVLAQSVGEGDAPSFSFETAEDGDYLIAFAPTAEAEAGRYSLTIGCEGTDEQCLRPSDRPAACRHEALYVAASSLAADATWDVCDVVLLTSVTVAEGATLTIEPGVTVTATQVGSGTFSDVALEVDGTLRTEGTEEAPVTFSPATDVDGWGGIVLNGPSNVLSYAVIEGAFVGVDLGDGADGVVSDTVIRGGGEGAAQGIVGIRAARDVSAEFVRALVMGFGQGLSLQNSRNLLVEDSVIRENEVGLRIDGVAPVSSCDPDDENIPPVEEFVDPVIRFSDIIENTGQGILLNGSDCLLQIEHSNIIGNGEGIEVRGLGLHEESFIRQNNIYDNGGDQWQGRQLITYHRAGPLDVSDNYWSTTTEQDQCWDLVCGDQGGELLVDSVAETAFDDAGPRPENVIDPVLRETWQGLDR